MERNIAEHLIGREIEEMRVESFFLDAKLVCEIIAVYVKTNDKNWYKFTISDGSNIIEKVDLEPKILDLSSISDEFAYPIKKINDGQIRGKIVDIKEYKWMGEKNEDVGIYVAIEDRKGFSLIENEDCIVFVNGMKQVDNSILVSCR